MREPETDVTDALLFDADTEKAAERVSRQWAWVILAASVTALVAIYTIPEPWGVVPLLVFMAIAVVSWIIRRYRIRSAGRHDYMGVWKSSVNRERHGSLTAARHGSRVYGRLTYLGAVNHGSVRSFVMNWPVPGAPPSVESHAFGLVTTAVAVGVSDTRALRGEYRLPSEHDRGTFGLAAI